MPNLFLDQDYLYVFLCCRGNYNWHSSESSLFEILKTFIWFDVINAFFWFCCHFQYFMTLKIALVIMFCFIIGNSSIRNKSFVRKSKKCCVVQACIYFKVSKTCEKCMTWEWNIYFSGTWIMKTLYKYLAWRQKYLHLKAYYIIIKFLWNYLSKICIPNICNR